MRRKGSTKVSTNPVGWGSPEARPTRRQSPTFRFLKASLVVVCGLVLIARSHAVADLVYFARGGQAQLSAKVEGDQVRLDTPDGPKVFARSDFAAIVPGHSPVDEWAVRRDASIRDGRTEARFAAAWWALENGLTDEAIAAFETCRSTAEPGSPAARALASIEKLSLPCPDPDLEPLRVKLRPQRFRETRGPHVVLFHQLDEADAAERLGLMERVATTFLVGFASQGVELRAPGRKLVSVCFADRGDYVDFLRKSDGQAFAETLGYYHPTWHVVFGFDSRSTEELKARRRAIANRKVADDPPSELARRTLLLDLDRRAMDLGILAHETVHQLSSDSGLVPHVEDFPTWLQEGLAAQFEVVRGGRWAGMGRAHDLRLPDWRGIRPAPRLAPLLRDVGLGRGYRRDLYAESWALVYYLRKAHPREFLSFLDLLRSPRADPTSRPDRPVEAFQAAFGADLAKLEADWHRFFADVQTPLERERPPVLETSSAAKPPEPERRLVDASTGH